MNIGSGMPLKSGKSYISKNVGELMHAYMKKGKIGTSHPKGKKAAQKQKRVLKIQSIESWQKSTIQKNNS